MKRTSETKTLMREKLDMKRVLFFEPWFFPFFGVFHLHRIWGLIDRHSYARFWLEVMESRNLFYYFLMGFLSILCIFGIVTFFQNRGNNYWWRWIYLFGGGYVLFDLFAIATGLKFWNRLLTLMFDTNAWYWNYLWSFFILMGAAVFALGCHVFHMRWPRKRTIL